MASDIKIPELASTGNERTPVLISPKKANHPEKQMNSV